MIIRYLLYILAILCFTNLQGQHYKKPNVVLIIIDDLNDFPEGFYGHPQAKTPHMKALGVSNTPCDSVATLFRDQTSWVKILLSEETNPFGR